MIEIRYADERGRGNHGWLDSRHSFSFAGYYDPGQMGHSVLRVINEDRVAPGAGFGTHGHRNMEIISLVLEGALEHRDSEGNVHCLPAGEFQLMSAGSGIRHSEYNASGSEPVRFLQIWIEPDQLGGAPAISKRASAVTRD
ncbi:pirin family protein [Marinobacterium aestuariivivens]|uniref:Pirin family protein n=1 Tax=Marinobacterium aestuariivivens TaxID=1698799 RepID=A0ABW2A3K5_9GAMM